MTSEGQYYSAKVFLRAITDAHQTLRDCAKVERTLDQTARQNQNLVRAIEQQQVVVKDGVLTPGKNFEQSKEIKLKNFSNELFKKSFGQFEAANNFSAARQALKKGLTDLKTQLGE